MNTRFSTAHSTNTIRISARFVWRRCVTGKGEDWGTDVQTAFAILQALWKNEYAAAHAAIDAYLAEASAGASGMMGRVLVALQSRLRTQVIALVRKGYSSIHIDNLAGMLGFAAADAQLSASAKAERTLKGAF